MHILTVYVYLINLRFCNKYIYNKKYKIKNKKSISIRTEVLKLLYNIKANLDTFSNFINKLISIWYNIIY